MSTDARAATLYRLFNDAGELIYVGVAYDHIARLAQHRRDSPWWPEVSSFTVEERLTRELAEKAERDAIREELPRYNVAHHPAYVQQDFGEGAAL